MKKITMITLLLILILSTQATFADENRDITIEYLEDGSSFITIIEDEPNNSMQLLSSSKTATKSKTTYFKNSDGEIMWYVKITGTFTYGNGSSKCTSYKPTASSKDNSWKVSNINGSKSGNHATATATGKLYCNGVVARSVIKSVTLTCSSTGVFS